MSAIGQLIMQRLEKRAFQLDASLLDNPAVGYGLAGAGLGGAMSLFKSLRGKRDPEESSVGAFLRSAALGGAAGAGLGAGAKMLGVNTPSIRNIPGMITGEAAPAPVSKADTVHSLGVGAAGAAGIGGLSMAQNARYRRQALEDTLRDRTELGKVTGIAGEASGKTKLTAGQTALGKKLDELVAIAQKDGGSKARKHLLAQIAELRKTGAPGEIVRGLETVRGTAGAADAAARAQQNWLARFSTAPGGLRRAALATGLLGAGHYVLGQ